MRNLCRVSHKDHVFEVTIYFNRRHKWSMNCLRFLSTFMCSILSIFCLFVPFLLVIVLFFPTFLLFFLSLFFSPSVCPINVLNGGALDSLKDGALDSLTDGALACSTLFCMFFGIAPCCKYSSRNS